MDIRTGGASIVTVNGKSYRGSSVSIVGNKIVVDGVEQGGDLVGPINVTVNGSAQSVQTASGNIEVHGAVGTVSTTSGDVRCDDVQGGVSTVSGDVQCRVIGGSVSTVSGDVHQSGK